MRQSMGSAEALYEPPLDDEMSPAHHAPLAQPTKIGAAAHKKVSFGAEPVIHRSISELQLKDSKSRRVDSGMKVKKAARKSRRVEQFVPTYIPKIGIANVTTATALPPPPPTLNPTDDYQPVDTRLGDMYFKQFVDPPTATPPPNKDAIALAFGCPFYVLPAKFKVESPSGCGETRAQKWRDLSGNELGSWQETCLDAGGMVTYKLPPPAGDTNAFSRTQASASGNKVDIMDCGLNKKFTFIENVFFKTDTKNHMACDRYGSCDGEVILQYSLADAAGNTVAITAMLDLFQDRFSISDTNGNHIANIYRAGRWGPWDGCKEGEDAYKKDWIVDMGSSPAGLTGPPVRWVTATFVTIIAMRDEYRKSTGMVGVTPCEGGTMTMLLACFLGIGVGGFLVIWCFQDIVVDKLKQTLMTVEDQFFPRNAMQSGKFDP